MRKRDATVNLELATEHGLCLPFTLKDDDENLLFVGLLVYKLPFGFKINRTVRAFLRRKSKYIKAEKMSEEIFTQLKDFFLAEDILCSHLFRGYNFFLVNVLEMLELRALFKEVNGHTSTLSPREDLRAYDHAYFWMIDTIEIKKKSDLKGTVHDASVSMSVLM
jgi:hypothetical protein